MNTFRLFIAVEIVQPDILTKITMLQDFMKGYTGIRMVHPNLLHFTLHFLGNTPATKINDLKRCIENIEVKKFYINLAGCGVFPNSRRPRVIWIGVTEGREKLIALQQQLKSALQERDFPVENRTYSPHLTLSRVKKLNAATTSIINHFLSQYQDFEAGQIPVTTVILKESTLTPTGPVYRKIYSKEIAYES